LNYQRQEKRATVPLTRPNWAARDWKILFALSIPRRSGSVLASTRFEDTPSEKHDLRTAGTLQTSANLQGEVVEIMPEAASTVRLL